MSRKLKKIRWLWQFDDLFTAPVFGYKDYMDYWTKCSSKPHLGGIRLPTLVLECQERSDRGIRSFTED
ncbi:hypothetical protein [Parasutterella sp.]|uniref:hypothetical protein n=1 Tax=Parasutterella sp. TaxID=2049037 RepID=UPI00352244D0